MEILNSRALKEAAIEKIGLARMYPSLADDAAAGGEKQWAAMSSAVESFSDKLVITPVEESTVVHLILTQRDPAVAARARNTLVDLYPVKRRAVYRHRGSAFLTSHREDFARPQNDAPRELAAINQ